MFQTKVVEKIQTHFLVFSNDFSENCAVYEMWKNIVKRDRSQMTIWLMCNGCWIPKATNINTGCVIHIAFPLQQWLQECNSKLYFLSC